MVRFLSVFPKPGAENLLRTSAARFEKLKREFCRENIKVDGEGCPQVDSGSYNKTIFSFKFPCFRFALVL